MPPLFLCTRHVILEVYESQIIGGSEWSFAGHMLRRGRVAIAYIFRSEIDTVPS